MAYNKRNKLLRIIDIQNVYQSAKMPGVTHVHVFREHIYPRFKISQRTLEEYLNVRAVAELKKLEDAEQNQTKFKQTAMEFPDAADQTGG